MTTVLNIINAILAVAVVTLLCSFDIGFISKNGEKVSEFKGDKVDAAYTPQVEALSFYSPILVNGLFGKASQGELTLITNTTVLEMAPVTAPAELMLLGTAVGSLRNTFALVLHKTKKEERVFRLGDMVFDIGSLAEVGKESACILINNTKVELLTPMTPPPSSAAPTQATALNVVTAVANRGGGSFVIDQRALNQVLDNPAQAMSDARLLPSQRDGKVEGFRASEVRPNGLFSMIGIKNGDVLLRLNDFPMDSPDKALQSFIALKGQNRLKLDLRRDGQPVTFNYDIR